MSVWETTFRSVLGHYQRRWFRWAFDPSWQKLAWIDAMAQADRAERVARPLPTSLDEHVRQKRWQDEMQARVSESVTRRFADLAQ